MSNFEKRLAANRRAVSKAVAVFEQLEHEFTSAAADQREIHDEIQERIDSLVGLRDQAMNDGLRNEERAKRVRELFL